MKYTRSTFLLILLTTLLFIIDFQANSQVTIAGKVVEKGSGEALPYATVLVKGSTNGITANQDGFFNLIDVVGDSLFTTYVDAKD